MTTTEVSNIMDESTNPDRREDQRVPKIQPCTYQLAQVAGEEVVDFVNGHALSLNDSSGGNLLLMPQPPDARQVFEVHRPLPPEGRTAVVLVEACWTKEITFGPAGKVYLVGVRSLFEPDLAG